MRSLISFLLFCLFHAYVMADPIEQESIRAIQSRQQLEKSLNVKPAVFSSLPPSYTPDFPLQELPCFKIHRIQLHPSTNPIFSFVISKLYQSLPFSPDLCLGNKNLNIIQEQAQNILIAQGFITSSIYFDTQDFNKNILYISVQPGYLYQIKFIDHKHSLTHLGQKTTFPITKERILNLFEVEQGLENIRRLNHTESDIDIVPSYLDNYSDLIVHRKQNKQFEIGVGVNSFDNKKTGKYQAESHLSIYSLFGFNDLFYTQYHQDIGHHKTQLTDSQGIRTDSGTRGYSVHYSLPLGYWIWQSNYSLNSYKDATEGMYRNYHYNGKTYQFNTLLNRTIFRNRKNKSDLSGKLWHTKIQKFLDKDEIDVQRRKMSGWEMSLSHLIQQDDYHIEGKISYKRGVGFQSIPAPEEFNDENDIFAGTARMKIISAELNLNKSFNLFHQHFSFSHYFYAQWNKTPLIPQDNLNLGSYYTVRGFDDDFTLQGERGWYSQNNLHWHYLLHHQIYLGVDYGYISGKTGKLQNKQKISGAILGIKGEKAFKENRFAYHLFISQPMEPRKHHSLLGFSTHYYF